MPPKPGPGGPTKGGPAPSGAHATTRGPMAEARRAAAPPETAAEAASTANVVALRRRRRRCGHRARRGRRRQRRRRRRHRRRQRPGDAPPPAPLLAGRTGGRGAPTRGRRHRRAARRQRRRGCRCRGGGPRGLTCSIPRHLHCGCSGLLMLENPVRSHHRCRFRSPPVLALSTESACGVPSHMTSATALFLSTCHVCGQLLARFAPLPGPARPPCPVPSRRLHPPLADFRSPRPLARPHRICYASTPRHKRRRLRGHSRQKLRQTQMQTCCDFCPSADGMPSGPGEQSGVAREASNVLS
mmetsp:Transcript_20018/g.69474  ORF Transcript_20018/g.69474 Transcript_20018/m.69474 type:complete len:299 (-) Transcript_20018:18-914(-)